MSNEFDKNNDSPNYIVTKRYGAKYEMIGSAIIIGSIVLGFMTLSFPVFALVGLVGLGVFVYGRFY